MQTNQIKRIELIARRWQDYYGNTYFSCNIMVNDITVHHIDFKYGYGSHYETVAGQWLSENVFSKQLQKKIGVTSSLWFIAKEIVGCKYVARVNDVQRKKDL